LKGPYVGEQSVRGGFAEADDDKFESESEDGDAGAKKIGRGKGRAIKTEEGSVDNRKRCASSFHPTTIRG
jgi:hypothetical protein